MLLIQVSDLHLDGSAERHGRAERVMAYVNGLTGVDAVLVSKDIADHGEPAEYAEAKQLLKSPHRILTCPGNHDVRDAYVEGLDVDARTVLEHEGLRFVMLDSLVEAVAGERVDEGRLGADQLAWLDRQLGASDDPAFVCLHHPPTTIGLELMDPIRLMDGDDLAAVIDHHPHVVATLVGHAHTMSATIFAGRPLLMGGGVVSTVTADAEQVDTLWYAAPPSFALHLVDDAESPPRVTTHWRALRAQ